MIYFLIPVFNEANNLELLAENLRNINLGEERFFVFVDDGSTDESAAEIKNYFKNEPFIVLGDGKNHGPGFSFNIGFDWILAQPQANENKVITIEADNTSDLSILPQLIGISRLGFNLVLASVYAQGGGFDKTTFLRKVLSGIANLLLRFIFDIKVQTLSSFYRIYDVGLLQAIKKKYGIIIEQSGFLCMVEILLKAIKQDARINEVPMVLYSKRRKGKSKMKVINTAFSYLKFLATNKIK